MFELFRVPLLKLLRVPHSPDTPAGSPGSTKVFNAARNFYTWSVVRWAAIQSVAALGVGAALIVNGVALIRNEAIPGWIRFALTVLEAVVVAGFLTQLVATFVALRIGYEMRWYIVTDRSLRIRSGVWSVEELTMTFANIQQIKVNQGPLQRLLGIADVEVLSAGGGGGEAGHVGRRSHAGYFEGVEDADGIRDLILERLRRYRDAGLGDPEDAPTALTAARDVLDEARKLRAALTR